MGVKKPIKTVVVDGVEQVVDENAKNTTAGTNSTVKTGNWTSASEIPFQQKPVMPKKKKTFFSFVEELNVTLLLIAMAIMAGIIFWIFL